jgi:hypothetical protein
MTCEFIDVIDSTYLMLSIHRCSCLDTFIECYFKLYYGSFSFTSILRNIRYTYIDQVTREYCIVQWDNVRFMIDSGTTFGNYILVCVIVRLLDLFVGFSFRLIFFLTFVVY